MDAVVPWVLIECGWSAKKRPRTGHWRAKSGLRTIGDPRYGVPYRLDRVMVLYLAHRAVSEGRAIQGNLRQVPTAFGLDWRPSTTLERLRRVAHCWYERPQSPDDELGERFAIVRRFALCRESGHFLIELSGDFMREVEAGAPIEPTVVKELATRPGPLDLYLWQATQLHRGQGATVEPFGPDGPFAVLEAPCHPAKARQEIRRRNRLIRTCWLESPYRISRDGEALLYQPLPAPRTDEAKQPVQPGDSLDAEQVALTSSGPDRPDAHDSTPVSSDPGTASPSRDDGPDNTSQPTPLPADATAMEEQVHNALAEFHDHVLGLLRLHRRPTPHTAESASDDSISLPLSPAPCPGSRAHRPSCRAPGAPAPTAAAVESPSARHSRATPRSRISPRIRRARKLKRDQQRKSRRRNR